MKVYLAGKVTKNGWRNELCDARDQAYGCCGEPGVATEGTVPKLPNGWIYSGPTLIACDHGCFHGRNKHGSLPRYGKVAQQDRARVSGRCRSQIRNSDCVFAWIDHPNVEGTLVEIGLAVAWGIPVAIGFAKGMGFRRMWFVRQFAVSSGVYENVREAYASLSERLEWAVQANLGAVA